MSFFLSFFLAEGKKAVFRLFKALMRLKDMTRQTFFARFFFKNIFLLFIFLLCILRFNQCLCMRPRFEEQRDLIA